MSSTPRFGLRFLSAGQAQKELFVNEALQTLDIAVNATVEEPPRGAPPSSPEIGATYVVGGSASGEWAGKDSCIAAFTSGGWRFIAPVEGLRALEKTSGNYLNYRGGAWEAGIVRGASLVIGGVQVVGARASSIPDPSGGSTIDSEARQVISQVLTALRTHGLVET